MGLTYIDSKGRLDPSTADGLNRLRGPRLSPVFHLDTNVAIDFTKLGDGGVRLDQVPHLAQIAQLAAAENIPLLWDLAAAEIGYDLDQHRIIPSSVQRVNQLVNRGIEVCRRELELSRSKQVPTAWLAAGEVPSYLRLLEVYYTHLLKIEILASEGRGKRLALPHLEEYLSWANVRLRNISPHCI